MHIVFMNQHYNVYNTLARLREERYPNSHPKQPNTLCIYKSNKQLITGHLVKADTWMPIIYMYLTTGLIAGTNKCDFRDHKSNRIT